jgi:hypothetical protein
MTTTQTTEVPSTFETTDQNTGRQVTWNVEVATTTQPGAPVWTHSVVATRPTGRSAWQMFVRVENGAVVRNSNPRKAW